MNLDATECEVFTRLNRTNRYKVKRTCRESVEVVTDDPRRNESDEFYRAIKEADDVVPDIEPDFDAVLWINAYKHGTLVAATCWFDSRVVLRAKHIVSTRRQSSADPALIGRLTRRLFWEACTMGLRDGHRYVDRGGIDVSDDPTRRGITAFKQSFGGEAVATYVYRHATTAWRDVSQAARLHGRVVL